MNWPQRIPYSYLESADRIGRRLCRDALWMGDRCNWLGWSLETLRDNRVPQYRSQNLSLFDGLAGIALFLAWLYRFNKEATIRDTAMGALTQLSHLLRESARVEDFGFYSGRAGIAYVYYQCSEIFEDERLMQQGLISLEAIRSCDISPNKLDLLSGSAGVIPILLQMGQRLGREEFIETADKHGHHIVARAQPSDDGWSWNTTGMPGENNLLGYAYGVSGIACALMELHQATGNTTYLNGALEGLRCERSNFDQQQNNWPVARRSSRYSAAPNQNVVAWAYGAPGVGFSRMRIQQLMPGDEYLTQELETAVQTTETALLHATLPGYGNMCLYQGAGGCADLLLCAAQVLNQPELTQAAETVGNNGIAHFAHTDMVWPCGAVPGKESQGLMLGVAGIGYFYLRLHAPLIVPSVLVTMPQPFALTDTSGS